MFRSLAFWAGRQEALSVGDTLAIVVRIDDEGLVAERLLEIYPVVGPVGEVAGDTAKIMGSLVHIPLDAKIKVGQWLAVSGLWSGNKAITSSYRRFGGGIAQLAGVVDQEGEKLGGSRVVNGHPPRRWIRERGLGV